MLGAFLTLDPATRVPWYGPDMSIPSSLTARIMETWAHGLDVADDPAAGRGAPGEGGAPGVAPDESEAPGGAAGEGGDPLPNAGKPVSGGGRETADDAPTAPARRTSGH